MQARQAMPYHAPLYLAQAKGFFKDEGIKVALLEPNDPSVSRTSVVDGSEANNLFRM